ncbi:MAG: hypothetical protein WKG07_22845 [Hymenobacter sp.]
MLLDIEVAAAVAPKARIVVYFAPNTSQGLSELDYDGHSRQNQQADRSFHQLGRPRIYLDHPGAGPVRPGVPGRRAAGHHGLLRGRRQRLGRWRGRRPAPRDFPASSPYALACGGTKLTADNQNIGSEVVWNEGPNSATGGRPQRPLPGARLPAAAQISYPPGRHQARPRPARRGRRRRPRHRLRGARRRPEPGHRRHQRRGPALGRPAGPAQPKAAEAGGLPESAALRLAGGPRRDARHHQREQRGLRGRAGLGCVYGMG